MAQDPIDGTVVAITGASAGIGAATAELLGSRGADVVLGARGPDALAQTAARVEAAGARVAWRPTDVRRREDLQGLVDLARDRFGRLDVLVSNAGYGPIAPVADLAVDDWQQIVEVNLMGVLWGVAAALPVFREQGSGHFVHVVSTSGLKIVPGQSVYAAAKNAARTFSEALRQEVGPDIRVTAVSPGMIATDFAASARDDRVRAEILAQRDKVAIPPAAIARAIAYAVEQPADVDVNEIVVRPTAQG